MKYQKSIYLLFIFTITILGSCDNGDNCLQQTWYEDADGDGFGNPNSTQLVCTAPSDYVSDNTDFDDDNATAYPGADEICDDNIDNNGDGEIDECGLIGKIVGVWTSNFGDPYTITSSFININGSIFEILVVGTDYVICRNSLLNSFNAGLYSKFVFTQLSTDKFYFCQPFYDSESQSYIENTTDPTNPNDLNNGCGSFSWVELTRD
ncbi:putative metal-binding motif-containing protein [Cyclobacterium qasimii]|uniref:Lipoprotein n=2 Tax=Cyclobacterium qasimii TaxID=1350429 RepID=S7VA63_9BACT|nr:putative metal-binding motif-containing protein [Cyclobacterium qasimii]EPR67120.1 hypothetical protein ADICYQ_3990 [Cyclobacterium qasimii M12-11B]GEO19677.1 hypothetical protein CQA01_02110 [Cyclobacterium qasimii]